VDRCNKDNFRKHWTVEELIKRLSEFPKDMTVCVGTHDGFWVEQHTYTYNGDFPDETVVDILA